MLHSEFHQGKANCSAVKTRKKQNNVTPLLAEIPKPCRYMPALGKLRKRMQVVFILPAAFVLFRGVPDADNISCFLWNSCTPPLYSHHLSTHPHSVSGSFDETIFFYFQINPFPYRETLGWHGHLGGMAKPHCRISHMCYFI